MKLENLIQGTVVKRPSKYVKTPYVADVMCDEQEVLAHTPALGCCGFADVGANVLMTRSTGNGKCSHTIWLSIPLENKKEGLSIPVENKKEGEWGNCVPPVGIHPKLAEMLVESSLKNNYLTILKNVKMYNRETAIYVKDHVDSRFDFSGIDENGVPFIMEVKNVPLADYEDMPKKEYAKMDFSNRDPYSKVAYFPDGYRKMAKDPISPRALKHIRELTFIKRKTRVRTIMCYVIQRTDVNRFQPSVIDPEYREAFYDAKTAGVEIITLVVRWNSDGTAEFIRDDLPIVEK
jgi:DNA-binding sugar fermentation-stimulating protein